MGRFGFSRSNNGSIQLALTLAMVVFTVYLGCWPADGNGIYLGRVHVYVNNYIAPSKTLNVHCKSKGDDLGWVTLAYQQNQTWSFKVNFWGTTLFWCSMEWHQEAGGLVQGSFEIYNYKRDFAKCDGICVWNVQQDGLYFLNPDTSNPPKLMLKWSN